MEWLRELLGEGERLTIFQMSLRAVVVFFAGLLMLRISGQRTFSSNTTIDNVIIIMLGAVLSRAITGASPFGPVLVAAFTMVLLNRILAKTALYWRMFGRMMIGEKKCLYSNGRVMEKNMNRYSISIEDLREAVRIQLHSDVLEDAAAIFIETSGKLSVLDKEHVNTYDR